MGDYRVHLRIAALVLVGASATFAQRDLATLFGTVKDPSGAVVPKAAVTVTDTTTNETYSLLTNEAGEFVRPALRPSTYTVSVSAQGFQTAERRNVILQAGARTGVDIVLSVGNIGQTVEVLGLSPLLETENTTVGSSLSSKNVSELPLGASRTVAF